MPARVRFVLASLAFAVVWIVAATLRPLGWPTASGVVGLVLAASLVYAWKARDGVFARALVVALVASFIELVVDWWLVERHGSLVYEPGGPFVWRSPLYMPFGWACALLQIGTLGLWVAEKRGLLLGSLAAAVLGAINIPVYEHCARSAGWWSYRDTPMIGNTPLYIVGADFLLCLALPFVLSRAARRPLAHSLLWGALLGLWLVASFAVAVPLLG